MMMAKRWRPRFSVRTLAILVTLVCLYLGLWELTASFGVREAPYDRFDYTDNVGGYGHPGLIRSTIRFESSPAPFIVRADDDSDTAQFDLWLVGPRVTIVKVKFAPR